MKYMVVYTGTAGDGYALCIDDQEATDFVEMKLREGYVEADIQIYTAEAVEYHVERIPVVRLEEGSAEKQDVLEKIEQEPSVDESAVDESVTVESDNPFDSEPVFSLDT